MECKLISRSPLPQNVEQDPSKDSSDQIHGNTGEGNFFTAPISNPDNQLSDNWTDAGNRQLSPVNLLSVRTSHPDLSVRRNTFPNQSKPTKVADNSPSRNSSSDLASDLLPSSYVKRKRTLTPAAKQYAAKVRKVGACSECRARKVKVCLI